MQKLFLRLIWEINISSASVFGEIFSSSHLSASLFLKSAS